MSVLIVSKFGDPITLSDDNPPANTDVVIARYPGLNVVEGMTQARMKGLTCVDDGVGYLTDRGNRRYKQALKRKMLSQHHTGTVAGATHLCPECKGRWAMRPNSVSKYAIYESYRMGPNGWVQLWAYPGAGDMTGKFLWSVSSANYNQGVSTLYKLPFPDQGSASTLEQAMHDAEKMFDAFVAEQG